MIAALCTWLSATPLNGMLQRTRWIIPTVQSIHILAVAATIAGALILNSRLIGATEEALADTRSMDRFIPQIWGALAVLLLTGALLIVAEPRRELLNPIFQLKMVMILAVVAFTGTVRHMARAQAGARAVKWLAGFSLALWVAILAAGRWIAYTADS